MGKELEDKLQKLEADKEKAEQLAKKYEKAMETDAPEKARFKSVARAKRNRQVAYEAVYRLLAKRTAPPAQARHRFRHVVTSVVQSAHAEPAGSRTGMLAE